MKKIWICLVLLLLLFSPPALAAENFDLAAEAGIAVDLRTGKILYEKDADTALPVANLSRLLTIYLVYEAVENGEIKWDDMVPISDYAYQLTYDPYIPNIPLENRQYTVRDLTKASIISASSSASIALAEYVAGSEELFVHQMQALLESWGLEKRLIVNASGLNNSYLGDHILPGTDSQAENTLSARDLALISQRLVKDFPDVLEFTQATRGNFAGTGIYTYNLLLTNMTYARPYAQGLITGSSDESGSSLISLTYENNMQVLLVMIGAKGGKNDPAKRFIIANDFLDQISQTFYLKKILPASTSYKDITAPVLDGISDQVAAVTLDDFFVVTTAENEKKIKLKPDFSSHENFAPIKEEQVVGKLVYEDPLLIGQGYLGEPAQIPLIAEEKVARTHIFQIIWNHFVRYVIKYL